MTVMDRVHQHYNEALEYFRDDRIVGIFLQGSQNYQLEVPNSDVDTKLIVVPSFKEIAFNKKAISTTHVRANDEYIDFKDIRLMFQTFRKQNLNFLEILFTDYSILNPLYERELKKLIEHNEEIAHYNPFLAVKAMKGVALEKYHAMEHRYPAKVEIIEKMGYDPKQLHHLLRVEEYLERYLKGDNYQDCLIPLQKDYLIEVKLGKYDLEKAREVADKSLNHILQICEPITKDSNYNISNPAVDKLLDETQYEIMKKATTFELTFELDTES